MISKETGHIDWNKTSFEIINLIRGLDPVPAAWTVYNGEVLKIWKVVVSILVMSMVQQRYN